MKTISQCVEEILSNQSFLEEALSRKIINYSALAEDLQSTISQMLRKEVQTGAIMMALRRCNSPAGVSNSAKVKESLRRLGDITVRSNICAFTYQNSDSLIQSNAMMLEKIDDIHHLFYAFTRGIAESNLMISGSKKDLVEDNFNQEKLIHFRGNLSAVSIKLPQDNYKITGLYYQIFKNLAWNGIAVYDVVSTTNEFIALVNDEVVDKAFSVIKGLKN
ncbi:hypothetical protein [Mesonia sp. K7]|uniref:hypothetical protein n=1 Tax=Mesonia sp. K7 TaxID=2218606 RepID=UPI000DA784EB|nr:hypothetical protein [Mesonia sp. K7]PZD78451.1 hypothetical protein DNG35_05155 [Mesonia sp. K7]